MSFSLSCRPTEVGLELRCLVCDDAQVVPLGPTLVTGVSVFVLVHRHGGMVGVPRQRVP